MKDDALGLQNGLTVGIDATSLRLGGGLTHLVELLGALDPQEDGIKQVVVWCGELTLAALPTRPWLTVINPVALNRGLFSRMWWQVTALSQAVKSAQCDILLLPGANYLGSFRPVVPINQTLLPFDWQAIRSNGISLRACKFLVLHQIQIWSFRHCDGVIFLTDFAKRQVLQVTGPISAMTTVIAHGLNPRFSLAPRLQKPLTNYSNSNPFQLLYVSMVDVYKHHTEVVEAVALLRQKGYPVHLQLIGPAEPKSLMKLQGALNALGPNQQYVNYAGALSYAALHAAYHQADLGIFASSCETFGMIVLEKMSAGLPIACSNQSSMAEILQDGGLYFDPFDPSSIASAIEAYLESPQLRAAKSQRAFDLAKAYSWSACARATATFLVCVSQEHRKRASKAS